MKKVINYLKFTSIFLIIEFAITILMSLLNLLGISSEITSLIIFIFNIILIFILNFINAKSKEKNGYLEGIILGLTIITILILLKLLFFHKAFSISNIIYYLILLFVSIVGGMIGINKKNNTN